jgi:hypothetical protein
MVLGCDYRIDSGLRPATLSLRSNAATLISAIRDSDPA